MQNKSFIILIIALVGFSNYSQTIVSTTAENRKAILEIYTGIYCGFCPDAQVVANDIKDTNPNDFFYYNIHQGGYAVPLEDDPDFRTPFGDALAGQTGLIGYPAGTINRQEFNGIPPQGSGGTALSRPDWPAATNQVLSENSYVNVALEADIDVQSNEITVHVEAYYTGNSPVSTNKLNVVLLQNNTKGPQSGGNMGDNYIHEQRLIHMITGQWGDVINTTSAGSFIDQTYTYTIPAALNEVPIEIGYLELVAFITESEQTIVSGNHTFPTYSNFAFANDIEVFETSGILAQCSSEVNTAFTIKNLGSDPLTSLDVAFTVNGGDTQTHTWTGELMPLQKENVEFSIPYDLEPVNTIEMALQPDDNNANNNATFTFDEALAYSSTLHLSIQTHFLGAECTWEIVNAAGDVIVSGGPYGNHQTHEIDIALPDVDCYSFHLYSISGFNGGPVSLMDAYDQVVYATDGDYGLGESVNFTTDGVLNTTVFNTPAIAIYPNPTSGLIQISTRATIDMTVVDINGKIVYRQNDVNHLDQIDLRELKTGIYFIKMSGVQVDEIQKVVKK